MYKQVKDKDSNTILNIVIRVSDGIYIPFDDLNKDYVIYKKWLDDGNIPLEAD